MWFSASAASFAVEVFVPPARGRFCPLLQIGHDEARASGPSSLSDSRHARDLILLDAAPAWCAIVELLVKRRGSLPSSSNRAFVLASRALSPTMPRRNVVVGADAEDVVDAVGATPIENLGATVNNGCRRA